MHHHRTAFIPADLGVVLRTGAEAGRQLRQQFWPTELSQQSFKCRCLGALPPGSAEHGRTSRSTPKLPRAEFPRKSSPKCPPVLTAGLPVGAGLDEEDVEGWWQVAGCLVLLVSLVKGHEEVLLHGQGGLGDTGTGFRSGDGAE